jgi:hypothetical protein
MLTPDDLRQIESLFRRIVSEQLKPSGRFTPGRIYNIADADVQQKLGVTGVKNPSKILIRKLKEAGIHITSVQRAGTTAEGSELNRYLDMYVQAQRSYLSKN